MNAKRSVQVNVDPNGEINVEFIGYLGEACAVEEERLRQTFATFGLTTDVRGSRQKGEAEQATEHARLNNVRRQTDVHHV